MEYSFQKLYTSGSHKLELSEISGVLQKTQIARPRPQGFQFGFCGLAPDRGFLKIPRWRCCRWAGSHGCRSDALQDPFGNWFFQLVEQGTCHFFFVTFFLSSNTGWPFTAHYDVQTSGWHLHDSGVPGIVCWHAGFISALKLPPWQQSPKAHIWQTHSPASLFRLASETWSSKILKDQRTPSHFLVAVVER